MNGSWSEINGLSLFSALRDLALPRGDFVISGSGPLFVRGWIAEIGDLDVLARGAAWERAQRLGPVVQAPLGDGMVTLCDGCIEICDGCRPMAWDLNRVIETADIIDGLPFLRLAYVLDLKRTLGREKDRAHIRLLEAHLAQP